MQLSIGNRLIFTDADNERRPGSKYASIQQVSYELRQADKLYKQLRIPSTDSTSMSVEEIATLVMQEKGIRRQSF